MDRGPLWGSEELADLYHKVVAERNALRRAIDAVLAHMDGVAVVDLAFVRSTLSEAIRHES